MVIPCFNYGRYLAEAVESVLAQTLPDVETIVVDDGSTDDSAAVAQALIDAHPGAALRLVRRANGGSPGATRNAGIAEARAPYVLCLDADDKLDPGFLAACVAALDADPHAAIAYSDFQMFGDSGQYIAAPGWDAQREIDSNFIGTAAVFRREAWEQAGGYAADVGYEDWDFWIAIAERGWAGVKVPGALWHYRVHGEGVYSGHLRDDATVKAEILLRHPAAYSERQLGWARAVLAGETPAEMPIAGVMPARTAPPIEGARGTAVLAFAGELIDDSALLRAWRDAFRADDNVTLVIHAPGWSDDEVAAKLGAAVAGAGLEGDDAADLLAWTLPLAGEPDAVLSRHVAPAPFAHLPRIGAEPGADLRALLAERLAA